MRRPAYLTAPEAAELLRCSVRSLHGLTAASRIPCRKLAGQRRILFLEDELAAWLDGAELEVIEREDGTKIVRPKGVS